MQSVKRRYVSVPWHPFIDYLFPILFFMDLCIALDWDSPGPHSILQRLAALTMSLAFAAATISRIVLTQLLNTSAPNPDPKVDAFVRRWHRFTLPLAIGFLFEALAFGLDAHPSLLNNCTRLIVGVVYTVGVAHTLLYCVEGSIE